jgi:hypothetical protein
MNHQPHPDDIPSYTAAFLSRPLIKYSSDYALRTNISSLHQKKFDVSKMHEENVAKVRLALGSND